jgi:DNA-binding HxlR family transcriptional regulator
MEPSAVPAVDWEAFFQVSDIKVLLYLYGDASTNREIRYSELLKSIIQTRSVLSNTLQDLKKRNLIDRIVEPSTPVKTRYKLTDKGIKLAQSLIVIKKLVS